MTMAGIVASLLCLPLGAALALLAYLVLDVPLQRFVTFDGALHVVAGLLAWWMLAFLAALAYAAWVLRAS